MNAVGEEQLPAPLRGRLFDSQLFEDLLAQTLSQLLALMAGQSALLSVAVHLGVARSLLELGPLLGQPPPEFSDLQTPSLEWMGRL